MSQEHDDGTVHPIAYASRLAYMHEQNYGISQLETLGPVWAVRYFCPYIFLTHPFILYVDHAACLSILNTTRLFACCVLITSEMNLTIKHKSGKKSTNEEVLSCCTTTDESKISAIVL